MSLPPPQPDLTAGPARVCLVVVFNHRFDANLDKLDQIYRPRFHHVRYLMPFYQGNRPDVFPVYYSSFQFNGFLLEAWRRLRSEGFTHFVFVADDLLLNPRLDEENICAELRLEAGQAFLHAPLPVTDVTCGWPYLMRALTAVLGNNGVNWERELPTYEEAAATLRSRGLAPGRFGLHSMLCRMTPRSFFLLLYYLALVAMRHQAAPGRRWNDAPYPLVVCYSDLFVVPATVMDRFCHLSGVFAAMGVFVEVGLPTALALCAPIVRMSDTRWHSVTDMQHPSKWEAYGQRHRFELKEAMAAMGEHELFAHPLKLSRWKL